MTRGAMLAMPLDLVVVCHSSCFSFQVLEGLKCSCLLFFVCFWGDSGFVSFLVRRRSWTRTPQTPQKYVLVDSWTPNSWARLVSTSLG